MPFEKPQTKPEEPQPKAPLRKRSVEDDVGYWPDPERSDQEKLRDDL